MVIAETTPPPVLEAERDDGTGSGDGGSRVEGDAPCVGPARLARVVRVTCDRRWAYGAPGAFHLLLAG